MRLLDLKGKTFITGVPRLSKKTRTVLYNLAPFIRRKMQVVYVAHTHNELRNVNRYFREFYGDKLRIIHLMSKLRECPKGEEVREYLKTIRSDDPLCPSFVGCQAIGCPHTDDCPYDKEFVQGNWDIILTVPEFLNDYGLPIQGVGQRNVKVKKETVIVFDECDVYRYKIHEIAAPRIMLAWEGKRRRIGISKFRGRLRDEIDCIMNHIIKHDFAIGDELKRMKMIPDYEKMRDRIAPIETRLTGAREHLKRHVHMLTYMDDLIKNLDLHQQYLETLVFPWSLKEVQFLETWINKHYLHILKLAKTGGLYLKWFIYVVKCNSYGTGTPYVATVSARHGRSIYAVFPYWDKVPLNRFYTKSENRVMISATEKPTLTLTDRTINLNPHNPPWYSKIDLHFFPGKMFTFNSRSPHEDIADGLHHVLDELHPIYPDRKFVFNYPNKDMAQKVSELLGEHADHIRLYSRSDMSRGVDVDGDIFVGVIPPRIPKEEERRRGSFEFVSTVVQDAFRVVKRDGSGVLVFVGDGWNVDRFRGMHPVYDHIFFNTSVGKAGGKYSREFNRLWSSLGY